MNFARRPWRPCALPFILLLSAQAVCAEVISLEVMQRAEVLGGVAFSGAGSYEKISGRITFAFDPENSANRRIVDLDKAPRDADGRVLAYANFMLLRPKSACPKPCVGLIEVSNRGSKAALPYFNNAAFADNPTSAEDFGDGLLLRRGLVLFWVGWQFDVPPGGHHLRLQAPVASEGGKPITGWVRSDWTLDQSTQFLPLGHRGHIAYPVADPKDPRNLLTERTGRLTPRHSISRDQWRFASAGDTGVVPDSPYLFMPSGFPAGRIYELVYVARDPPVVGLGLAAIRDLASYAKYGPNSDWQVDFAIAFGVSQSGRFLRHFLYQGFNIDEHGRKVFDGMLIHAAGAGRGSFNHRFAQPSRDAHRFAAFFYPTDLFPFSGWVQEDPRSGEGLLAGKASDWPKIMYTNTGYEYWGRAASLIHIAVTGAGDIQALPNERLYHLAGAQHFMSDFPPWERLGQCSASYRGNPLDFLVVLRALLLDLTEWVTHEREPLESLHPRLDDGTLVSLRELRWPKLPGMAFPQVAHEAYRVDYGPRWAEGIIDKEPPEIGQAFPLRLPQVDAVGNERGGVQGVELRVPLASYFPWSLRVDQSWARDELMDFWGTVVPFPWTALQRRMSGDPRPSVIERYGRRKTYLARVNEAAGQLIEEGFLLKEDWPRVMRRAETMWEWVKDANKSMHAEGRCQ
ncbi:MAG: alpha/beta hydrolase domain-containing protein [Gammaproteobacteria bacterium]